MRLFCTGEGKTMKYRPNRLMITMELSKKFIAIPAIAIAAGFGLAGCGTSHTAAAPAVTHTVIASPAPTTPKLTTPAPATPALINLFNQADANHQRSRGPQGHAQRLS